MNLQEIKAAIKSHEEAIFGLEFAAKKEFMREVQELANKGFTIYLGGLHGNSIYNDERTVKVEPQNLEIKLAICKLLDIVDSIGTYIESCEFSPE